MPCEVRLSTAIFACLGLTAGGSMVVLGWIQSERMTQLVRERAYREQATAAAALAKQLEHLMELELRSVEALASIIDGQLPRLEPAPLSALLEQHQERFSEMHIILAMDAAGRALAVSPARFAGAGPRDYSDRDYYRDLVRHQRSAVSRVQIGKRSHRPSVNVAAAIGRPARGYLVMGYPVEEFGTVARRAVERLSGARVLIWDWQRRVVADTALTSPSEVQVLPRMGVLRSDATVEVQARMGRVDADGASMSGALAQARIGPRSWSVLVMRPSAAITRESQSIGLEVLLVTMLVLAAAGTVALLLARWVAAPITRLSSVAKEVADGAFDASFKSNAESFRPREARFLEQTLCEMQQRIQTHTEELEHRVRARTLALEMARNEALATSKHKSEFIANMSHEIRTPMNGVLGNIQLLAETANTADQKEFARTAHSSALSLLELLNDILDFSKLEADQLSLEEEPFDLWDQVYTVVETFGAAASQKGIQLIVRIRPSTPTHLVGDASRIRQIISNLVGNALKFTQQGTVAIHIAGQAHPEDGTAKLDVQVIDTGIGIPQNRVDAIFDDFAQVDGSTTRKYGGTGLGLAIVRRLAELMGGDARVESMVGVGSCFMVDLHVLLPAEPKPRPDRVFAGRPPGAALVFSEDEAQALAIADQLEYLQLPVILCEDLAKAGQLLLGESPPSVVIVDEGHVSAIRALAEPKVPVIRWLRLGHQVWAPMALGAENILLQPARPERLTEALNKAWGLGHAPARQANRKTKLRGRVLAVDDNIVNQRVITKMLELTGLEVEVAEDGNQAFEMARDQMFDLVLMDCQMPELDGYDATRLIRRLPGDKGRVPVIALSANASDENRQRCLAVGMDEHMSKPVVKDRLVAVLAKYLASDDQAD